MPTSKSIMRHTWEKGAQYLKKMGGIIMIASIIIWFLGYYPRHDAHESVAEQQEKFIYRTNRQSNRACYQTARI